MLFSPLIFYKQGLSETMNRLALQDAAYDDEQFHEGKTSGYTFTCPLSVDNTTNSLVTGGSKSSGNSLFLSRSAITVFISLFSKVV